MEYKCVEDSLYRYLFDNGYNKYVKPSISLKDVMVVNLKLFVTQLVDVDEKNLLMTTNIWLDQVTFAMTNWLLPKIHENMLFRNNVTLY